MFKKEADKWFKGLERVNAQAAAFGKRIVLAQDRKSDILDFFKAYRAEPVELLESECQNQMLQDTTSAETFRLEQAKENLYPAGHHAGKDRAAEQGNIFAL